MYLSYEKYIKRIIHEAKGIIMPQYDRAVLYQTHYKLEQRPYVLPNKPYFDISLEEIKNIEGKYKNYLDVFKSHKVILYQGILHPERDLSSFVKAVKCLGEEYKLVLIGKDKGSLESYKKIDPNICYIPFIPAPDYLIFTKNAYIGILTYDAGDLNCAYCAPNKIYEYSKYSLPMLGNDIPGLKYTMELNKFGEIVDDKSIESIKDGILKIEANYDLYSNNSNRFFMDTDNVKTVKEIFGI